MARTGRSTKTLDLRLLEEQAGIAYEALVGGTLWQGGQPTSLTDKEALERCEPVVRAMPALTAAIRGARAERDKLRRFVDRFVETTRGEHGVGPDSPRMGPDLTPLCRCGRPFNDCGVLLLREQALALLEAL